MLTTEYTINTDAYTPLVNQVMAVEGVTLGGSPQQNYLVRYSGQLRGDSQAAYDSLAANLRLLDITPLFRQEAGKHVILLMRGVLNPRPSNPWVNLLMFVLTFISMVITGIFFAPVPGAPDFAWWSGLPFAVSLLAILLAHEFGHYLAGRFHRTHVTLPYFIPLPLLSPLGTMGAFIQLKEPPKNKRILLDIGLAGPLAGLLVAVPVLLLGLSLSQVQPLGFTGQTVMEGNSLLYLLSKFVVFGRLLPAPADYGDVSPLLYWVRYFFTGQPFPFGGEDVMIHPVAWAGWAGLLVTALNLLPAGQLDGGHLIYVLFGKRARVLLPIILVALILLGFAWQGWWLWAVIIFLLGRSNAEPLDQITPLDPRRRAVAFLGLILFFLVFTPVPLFQVVGG